MNSFDLKLLNGMQWYIHHPVLFAVVRHGVADGLWRLVLFNVGFQAFGFQVFFRFNFYRDNALSAL